MFDVSNSKRCSLIWVVFLTKIFSISGQDVFVEVDGLKATLGNGLINITFTENSQVSSLLKNGSNIIDVNAKTFYLDWNGGRGVFFPTNLTVLNDTGDMAHIMYYQPGGSGFLRLENHFIMLKNISGVYQYVKASNPSDNETLDISELRTVHRFSPSLMPHMTNGHRIGDNPDLYNRPTIQDTTWQMVDGSYWSKYDYCAYIRKTPWFGIFGGGFGAWVVSASREYHSGGPLKQDLLVHQASLSANYLTSSHYGTPNHQAVPGWSKFFGPWLIYVNTGADEDVLADASKQAKIEKEKWPYSWVSDSDYPLNRGSVTGQVIGQVNSEVVLWSSTSEAFDIQTKGYLYYTKTNKNGSFILENIRPGNYRLIAYPLAGHASEIVAEQNITVSEGHQDAGTLHLPILTDILWNIGETNRRADGFRYSDELRNFYWHTLPPVDHTFVVGKSHEAKDWYYAQSHNGTWNIVFNDTRDNNPRTLRVAIAAASGSLIFNVTTARLSVSVNSFNVAELQYENDKAIYRDALQSGNFYAEKITVDADKVVDGINVVSLTVVDGMFMYDAISYQRNSDNVTNASDRKSVV